MTMNLDDQNSNNRALEKKAKNITRNMLSDLTVA